MAWRRIIESKLDADRSAGGDIGRAVRWQSQEMLIHFEFVDGPMKGTELSGEAEGDNEAACFYSMTRNGAVGAEFSTISANGRLAIEEWVKSSGSTQVGGPYEHYLYRVVDRIENESAIYVWAAFVDRMPFPR